MPCFPIIIILNKSVVFFFFSFLKLTFYNKLVITIIIITLAQIDIGRVKSIMEKKKKHKFYLTIGVGSFAATSSSRIITATVLYCVRRYR